MKRLITAISFSLLLFSCDLLNYRQSDIDDSKQYVSAGITIREGTTFATLVAKAGVNAKTTWSFYNPAGSDTNPDIFGVQVVIERPNGKKAGKNIILRIIANKATKTYEVSHMQVDGSLYENNYAGYAFEAMVLEDSFGN